MLEGNMSQHALLFHVQLVDKVTFKIFLLILKYNLQFTKSENKIISSINSLFVVFYPSFCNTQQEVIQSGEKNPQTIGGMQVR